MSTYRPPEWAELLGEMYVEFRKVLGAALAERGFEFDEDEGVAQRGEEIVFLRSLATRCSGEPDRWDELIEEHLGIVIPGPDERAATFDVVEGDLRLALFPRSVLDAGEPDFEYADFGDELIEVVCIDGNASVESVTSSQMNEWGLSWDELRRIGAENLREDIYGEISVEVSGGAYTMVTGAGFCTSGRAAVLPRSLARGLLVAVPNRHTVMYHRVRGTGSLLVAKAMAEVATKMYAEGEGRRSPNVHFAYEGEVHSTTLEVTEEGVDLTFPEPFIELMRDVERRTRRNPDDPYEAPRDDAESAFDPPFEGGVGGALDLVNKRLISSNIPGFLLFCAASVILWSTPIQSELSAAAVVGVILLVVARLVSLTLTRMFSEIVQDRHANWITAVPSLGLVAKTFPISIFGACFVVGTTVLSARIAGEPTSFYGLPIHVSLVMFLGMAGYATLAAACNPFWVAGRGFIGGLVGGWKLIWSDPIRLALCLLVILPLWLVGGGCVLIFGFGDAMLKALFVRGWWRMERDRRQQVDDPFENI